MPPSPAMRVSPGRAENHKRGRSLESGIQLRDKDDDLALFNEVQNTERDNFLLQSNDDLDDIFSTKLRNFSKLGISIPARGESSDLLNAEGDKNDYDWLITPPETPLFTSLDDEAPTGSLAPRGRPRSQPISISRSSTMEKEKGYRSTRGSPSPHRLSPSPSSASSTLQSRSTPFSAIYSSPPCMLRHSSPSRRLSPPPSKPTGTPTPRRMSTGSAGATVPSKARGTSPINTSRGNSASPKIKAWQSNIPGFSSEAPPNLRTSLADRPASYVRGSSPASRNGSRSQRQSMSPTASRSVSSSHSHERDQFSSHSKGSVASSGDDDVDSIQSHPVGSSDSFARTVSALPNKKAMGFSKKPAKVLSSSAPKRSFDLALRQMERKGPQNMFRPLLSSVPSSTFYAGKSSVRALTSRNSSITTSSNASSDQGTSGALDTEENELNQEDVTSDFVKGKYLTVNDEVFDMDQVDVSNEAVDDRMTNESPGCQHDENDEPSTVISQLGVAESSEQLDYATAMDPADVLGRKYDYSDADGVPDTVVCSNCSLKFHLSELVWEGELWLCMVCKSLKVKSATTISMEPVVTDENMMGENESLKVLDCSASIQDSLQAGGTRTEHLDGITKDGLHLEPSNDNPTLIGEREQPTFASQQEINQSVDNITGRHQSSVISNSSVDVSEGTGISLVLKRPSGGKGPLVQSRSFTASNISYDDFSYVRDSVNSMRSSIGHGSVSVSSSIDMGSSRQTETRIHRQSSSRKSDMENYRYETPPMKHKRSISSLSGTSGHTFSVAPSCLDDTFEVIAADKDKEVGGVTYTADLREQSLAASDSTCSDVESSIIMKTAAELPSHLIDVHSGGASVLAPDQESASHDNGDNLTTTLTNPNHEETLAAHLQTSTQGEYVDVAEVPCLDARSEIEVENADTVPADSQSDADSMNEVLDPTASVVHNDVMTTAAEEIDTSIPVNEESTIVLQNLGGTKSRSLTLEEATDAILFCSSIVHNLAYEAANIAIEKEKPSVEALQPTVTFVGKSNSDRRDIHSRTLGKRASRSQKARQRRLEKDVKPPSIIGDQTDNKTTPVIVRSPSKADTMVPPKLESKCNCTIM